jgi:N-methylhydantoinase A
MELDIPATYAGIEERLATRLGLSLERTAWGIHQIVNETMASAARAHVIERGKDPQRQPLFAFGGCGPVHGYRIAKALGSPSMIVPLGAGIVSTVGFLSAPTSFDFVRPWRTELATIDWQRAADLLERMTAEGREVLLASGVPEPDISVLYSVDMRYVGQGFEIVVPLPDLALAVAERHDVLLESFRKAYLQVYGRSGPPVPAEIINWRTTVTGPKPEVRLRIPDAGPGFPQKGRRRAYFPELGGYAEVPVYDRYAMPRGFTFQGPALVEERESTTVIGPDGRCRIDEQWNLVVDLG